VGGGGRGKQPRTGEGVNKGSWGGSEQGQVGGGVSKDGGGEGVTKDKGWGGWGVMPAWVSCDQVRTFIKTT
jgi:hypothetical protein